MAGNTQAFDEIRLVVVGMMILCGNGATLIAGAFGTRAATLLRQGSLSHAVFLSFCRR